MYTMIYPADPDCPKCHGSGTVSDSGGKEPNAWFHIGPCNCQGLQNLEKIRARCKHEFVCKKCGTYCGEKSHEKDKSG